MPAPYSRQSDNPLRRMQVVTKSNSTVYDPPLVLLRCAEAGDVTIVTLDDVSVLISDVIAGEYIPGPIKQVMSTGTNGTLFTGWKNE